MRGAQPASHEEAARRRACSLDRRHTGGDARPRQRFESRAVAAMTEPGFLAQLQGYGLTTAEIHFYRPDAPSLLQLFVWQEYDLAPDSPVLFEFRSAERRVGKGGVSTCDFRWVPYH